jgi:signal transduction histidine kinase
MKDERRQQEETSAEESVLIHPSSLILHPSVRGGLATFLVIAALLAGGLGWATWAALRLEAEQRRDRADAERVDRQRVALWRLDNQLTAILAGEDARPFSHYSAIYAPAGAVDASGLPVPPGAVLELSPLLSAELPPWMLLHFQTDEAGWESPQVLSAMLQARLRARTLTNRTAARGELLAGLARDLPAKQLIERTRRCAGNTVIRDRALLARLNRFNDNLTNTSGSNYQGNSTYDVQAANEYYRRQQARLVNPPRNEERIAKNVVLLNFCRNGEEWLEDAPAGKVAFGTNPPGSQTFLWQAIAGPRLPSSAEVTVSMSRLVGVWLAVGGRNRLALLRLVRIEEKDVCQGIVLDDDMLCSLLAGEVEDLFPGSRVLPAGDPTDEQLGWTMTTLPLRLEIDSDEPEAAVGWTPLRVGLSLAWLAALVGLAVVGLGGWSLLSLSQRRIRFVSAVTHELRTPLTTLRLYLDMLTGGVVSGEKQRDEYLQTMQVETERLARLVGNVLDFSRLENQEPKVTRAPVSVAGLLDRARDTWQGRCATAGKCLEVEDGTQAGCTISTDGDLFGQVLANLLDNACKYSREAADRRVWLRARQEGRCVVFEVEDRGPGVPAGERRTIFRPFRRGACADATTGGVGLGLALARWWTEMLGGRLSLRCPSEGGACFRVEL